MPFLSLISSYLQIHTNSWPLIKCLDEVAMLTLLRSRLLLETLLLLLLGEENTPSVGGVGFPRIGDAGVELCGELPSVNRCTGIHMDECLKNYGRDSAEVKVNADLLPCSVLGSIGSRKDYSQEDDPQDKMISAISA